jgi:hypothetical protein
MANIDEYDDDNFVVMPGKRGKANNTLSYETVTNIKGYLFFICYVMKNRNIIQ